MATAPKGFASKNQRQEEILGRYPVSFSRNKMLIADVSKDPDYQVRLHSRTSGVVAMYANQMEAGAEMPPTVTYRDPATNTVYNIDGDGRTAAAEKLGYSYVQTYTIEGPVDPNLLVAIAGELNCHGEPMRNDERRRGVMHALRAGMTDTEIVAGQGLSKSVVKRYRTEFDFDMRAEARGLKFDEVPITAKAGVLSLRDDAVFDKVVNLIQDQHLDVATVRDVLQRVGSATSEADRLKEVTTTAKASAAAGKAAAAGVSNCAGDASRVIGQVFAQIGRCPDPASWVPLTPDDRLIRKPKLDDVVDFLVKVQAEFDAAI